jgi:hypothetical protein
MLEFGSRTSMQATPISSCSQDSLFDPDRRYAYRLALAVHPFERLLSLRMLLRAAYWPTRIIVSPFLLSDYRTHRTLDLVHSASSSIREKSESVLKSWSFGSPRSQVHQPGRLPRLKSLWCNEFALLSSFL